MINSSRGKIAPYQLFFVLFVSRIVVTLTYIQTVSVGELGTDFLFSVLLSWAVTMLMSLPIIICVNKGKSPLDNKLVCILYSLYFVWTSAVSISRFSYFASSRLNTDSSMIFFVIIISVAVCYCACLGIEGVSRFGAFCGLILVLTLLTVMIFNLHNLRLLNYYPIFTNSTSGVIKNGFVISSNSAEPIVFLALADRVNGNRVKPLLWGVSASYLVIFLLIFFIIGVMGGGASLQSYPVFTLFQLASFGSMSRLDVLHIAFWVLALLLKCSVLCYCASIGIKKFKHNQKCIGVSVLIGVVAILVAEYLSMTSNNLTKILSVGVFVFFSVVIPLCTLILRRKSVEN